MVVRSVDLRCFRSYERLELEVGEGVTHLVGPNGVGKTNLLEAIALGLLGSSPRTTSELRCIRQGASFARVELELPPQHRVVVVEAGVGKRLSVDGAQQGVEAFASSAATAVFLPERLLVVRGAPARRRGTLDRLLARTNLAARRPLAQYVKALSQRNVVLRAARGGASVEDRIAPWTEQLLELGAEVRMLRAELLDELRPHFARALEQLTGLGGGDLVLELRGAVLEDAATEHRELDRRRGSTTWGPHLDELHLLAEGRDMRTFGSTGEQRATLLAWTFAEADVVGRRTGRPPVLLLDEVFAELDPDRRTRLRQALDAYRQVILTSTEEPARSTAAAAGDTMVVVSSGAAHIA